MPSPKWCCGAKEKVGNWQIDINTGEKNPNYQNNYTSTTKYSLLTFLPKALFEQYRRVANIYFTITCEETKQLTPETVYTFKGTIECEPSNTRRYQFRPSHWLLKQCTPSKALLSVSLPMHAATKTKQLTPETVYTFKGTIECEPPNARRYQFTKQLTPETVYTFKGTIECEPSNTRRYQFRPSHWLLKQCTPSKALLSVSLPMARRYQVYSAPPAKSTPTATGLVHRKKPSIL
eukprot:gene23702-9243_t